MSFYISFDNIKKTGMLFFLLSQSMVVYAESADTVTTGSEVTAEPANAASVNKEQQAEFNFPGWPVRQHAVKDSLPPPPPGPYMSLGLNDFPVSESFFDSKSNKQQIELNSSAVPIQTFSPDVPWPKNIRPTNRWMPEHGYRYVDPQIAKQPYPAVQNRPAYNYGYNYQRDPNMAWYGPSMSPGSYRYTPDYRSAYNNPANNNHTQPGNPSYRTPYPVTGKP